MFAGAAESRFPIGAARHIGMTSNFGGEGWALSAIAFCSGIH
jgi:hypothetical protein